MPLPYPYDSWSGGYSIVNGRDSRSDTSYMFGRILAATLIRVSSEFNSPLSTTYGLQEAVDDLPATGGEVFVPPGTSLASVSIVVNKPDVHITGAGGASIIRLADGSNVDVFTFTAAALRFELDHVAIDGNLAGNVAGSGVVGDNALNAHIHHAYVYHCAEHGVKITRSGTDPEEDRVANCHVHGCAGNGIYFETYVVDSSVVENVCNNNNNGIYLQAGNRNLVEGNTCRWNLTHGIVIEDEETVVSDNICTFNQGHGIYVNTAGSTMVSDNTVNGNVQDGIRIYRSSRCHVSDNHVYDQGNGWSEIHIEGDGAGDASYNTISGNECYRYVTFNTDYGIRIVGGANAVGNRLFNNVATDHDVADLDDGGLNTVYGHNQFG